MRDRQAAYTLGMGAEAQCAAFLRARGYRVIAERLRTQGGEIDIVATQDDTLVIVEVKARGCERDALESITPAKQKRLVRATEALLAGLGVGKALDLPALPPNIRFDVMVVLPMREPLHLADAWRPDETCI